MSENMQMKKKAFRGVLKNRSLDYNRYGKYLVEDFDYSTLWMRLIGQLGDIIIMLLPVILWIDLFLLVASGWVSVSILYGFTLVTVALLIVSVVAGNTYISYLFKGQSFGKLALKMKVVNMDNTELDRNTVIIREAAGKAIPIILLYIILGLKGVALFLLVNGLVVLFDRKYHRSIIDIALKTKVVILNDKGMRPPEKKPTEVVEITPSKNKIDLHINSSFSHDGDLSVEDIFKEAKALGLNTISICDHNTVKANQIAHRLAPLYGIEYVPGINIDCNYKGYHVRLLGYFINSNAQRFADIEYENLAKEKAVSLRRIQLFEEFSGFHIDSEQLMEHNRFHVITPEMIARYILTNVNYQNEKILQPYLKGSKRNKPITQFVQDFFGKGKPAYVATVHPALEDMISAVKAAGGACVLAHPMASLNGDIKMIKEIVSLGIDGIEVFNPKHSRGDQKALLELARTLHLEVVAGSEYHGKTKKEYHLGDTTCPIEVEDVVYHFVNKFKGANEI